MGLVLASVERRRTGGPARAAHDRSSLCRTRGPAQLSRGRGLPAQSPHRRARSPVPGDGDLACCAGRARHHLRLRLERARRKASDTDSNPDRRVDRGIWSVADVDDHAVDLMTTQAAWSDAEWEAAWAPYDETTYRAALELIRPDDVVLDIGAGDLRFARRAAARARTVIAVEQRAELLTGS